MTFLPRIAVGTVQAGAEHQTMAATLMQVLGDQGLRVQPFFAQGCFAAYDVADTVTHLRRRYLDSWLMRSDVCIELFEMGSEFADVAVVEGRYDAARSNSSVGGSLDRLAEYLELPKLTILDASRLPTGWLPSLPSQSAGILLDKVTDTAQYCHLQTVLESLLDVPVLGSLGELASMRAVLAHASTDSAPARELCAALGRELRARLDLKQILELASARPLPTTCQGVFDTANRWHRPLHVGVALDAAFTCYFADTLDVLEQRGATVSVFSPLSSDHLPSGCDILYFGCGRPEQFASQLAGNICMKEAIWEHVLSGGRVYAESGGMAYLVREMELPDGQRWPMVGILPAVAHLNANPRGPEPAMVHVDTDCWLFASGQQARGYLNHRWSFDAATELLTLASDQGNDGTILGNYQVVGSRMNLHFASQPALIRHFFQPAPPRHVHITN